MIQLETAEDIELIKQLVFALGSNGQNKDDIVDAISLSIKTIEKSQKKIDEHLSLMDTKFSKLEENFEEFKKGFDLKQKTVKSKEEKPKKKRAKSDDNFVAYKAGQSPYYYLDLEGVNIIHRFINKGVEREVYLPLNVFEVLTVIERYRINNDSLKHKDVSMFCKMFKINKQQFSKIFYNLELGKFDPIIAMMDKMIGESLFTIEKGTIHRNGHDTKLNTKKFNELVSIYVNDPYPLSALCKIVKEEKDYESFDLFCTLRKSNVVSKILGA